MTLMYCKPQSKGAEPGGHAHSAVDFSAELAAPIVEPEVEPKTTHDTTPVPSPGEAPQYLPGTAPTTDAEPVPNQCPIPSRFGSC
jgi:hypothetical protein